MTGVCGSGSAATRRFTMVRRSRRSVRGAGGANCVNEMSHDRPAWLSVTLAPIMMGGCWHCWVILAAACLVWLYFGDGRNVSVCVSACLYVMYNNALCECKRAEGNSLLHFFLLVLFHWILCTATCAAPSQLDSHESSLASETICIAVIYKCI